MHINFQKAYINAILYHQKDKIVVSDFKYNLYSVIEPNNIDYRIYIEINNYIQKILVFSRDPTKKYITDIIFNRENDNNRDKFLNNMGLLIVGFTNSEYICILLYPLLFRAYKAYQMSIDTIKSTSDSDHIHIFEKGDRNYTKYGGSWEAIRKALKEKNRQKNKLEFLLDLYNTQMIQKLEDVCLLDIFPFFKIPLMRAQQWYPMIIKPFNNYLANYSINYKYIKKFIIMGHGTTIHNTATTLSRKTPAVIDLYPNEIVIMSCNPKEVTSSNKIYHMAMELISPDNNDLIHFEHIKTLLNITENGNRMTFKNFAIGDTTYQGGRNNYCIYTKRCPNVKLSFYDYGSEFRDNIPYFVFLFILKNKLLDRCRTKKKIPDKSK
jgi:hypothetical protein